MDPDLVVLLLFALTGVVATIGAGVFLRVIALLLSLVVREGHRDRQRLAQRMGLALAPDGSLAGEIESAAGRLSAARAAMRGTERA